MKSGLMVQSGTGLESLASPDAATEPNRLTEVGFYRLFHGGGHLNRGKTLIIVG
jgi:hypothetical protein